MRKSAILFDFDFTLADSSKGAVACMNYALSEMRHNPATWDACCATIGLSLPETYRALTGDNSIENAKKFRDHFQNKADDVMTDNTIIYDGVPDVLVGLNDRGFQLGILSTKFRYRINQILARDGLAQTFAHVIGGEDVTAHKPDPEGIYRFMSMASIEPTELVMVGDSLADAEAAHRAGVDFIAVMTGATAAEAFGPFSPKAIMTSVLAVTETAILSQR